MRKKFFIKLNPITKRRLANFKSNKRGYISFWIFISMFLISLFAEFIANDKPIIISYNSKIIFPIFKVYSEQYFGGEFDTEADYRDTYVKDLINANGWMIWPVIRYKFDTINYNLSVPAPAPPSSDNLLGTDDQGHDVLAIIIYGFRISVFFGLLLTIFSTMLGVTAGALQGYFGGLLDLIFQRIIEIWSSLPSLYILIILSSLFEPSFFLLQATLLLFSWMTLVGVVRAEFLKTRNFDYVKAAKALGVHNINIIYKHLIPNSMVSTLTYLPFILNGSIITLTSLDFLNFGLPLDYPSLGRLLAQAKSNLQAPWLGITVFLVLSIMLSLLVFIGEAVRDAFDPRRTS